MNITNDGTPYPFAMGPTDNGTKLEINNMAEQNDKQKQLLIEVMNADAKDGLYKQQTAVEWLEEELAKNLKHIVQNADSDLMESLFEQAKQMEKEQQIKDYNVGYTDAQCNHINDAENYINEQKYLSSND